jgi:hypothetical protein
MYQKSREDDHGDSYSQHFHEKQQSSAEEQKSVPVGLLRIVGAGGKMGGSMVRVALSRARTRPYRLESDSTEIRIEAESNVSSRELQKVRSGGEPGDGVCAVPVCSILPL